MVWAVIDQELFSIKALHPHIPIMQRAPANRRRPDEDETDVQDQ
jgi:hypothetical protein